MKRHTVEAIELINFECSTIIASQAGNGINKRMTIKSQILANGQIVSAFNVFDATTDTNMVVQNLNQAIEIYNDI